MKGKILRTAAAVAVAVLLLTQNVAAAPTLSAKSAVLLDAATGRVLFEQNADAKSLIASTTKIMTGLLVCERCDPDKPVTIPPEAVGVEGSSMYLKAGETLTVHELLYGMLLRSGNDAAVALAIHCAGSVEQFATLMNARAADMGLTTTHFANPNGLDDENNYSSARELAVLARTAMENELFREIVSTKSVTVGARSLTNHNKLLWQYEGAEGVKTGYTKAAGRILVSSAMREGRRLIAVTICDPCDWNDHARLLDYGFSSFEARTLVQAGADIANVPVMNGVKGSAALAADAEFSYPMMEGETATLRVCAPHFVFAPVQAGTYAGYAEVLLGGQVIGTTGLVWAETIEQPPEKPGLLERIFGG